MNKCNYGREKDEKIELFHNIIETKIVFTNLWLRLF